MLEFTRPEKAAEAGIKGQLLGGVIGLIERPRHRGIGGNR